MTVPVISREVNRTGFSEQWSWWDESPKPLSKTRQHFLGKKYNGDKCDKCWEGSGTFQVYPTWIPVWQCWLIAFIDHCFRLDFMDDTCWSRTSSCSARGGILHIYVCVCVCSDQRCLCRRHSCVSFLSLFGVDWWWVDWGVLSTIRMLCLGMEGKEWGCRYGGWGVKFSRERMFVPFLGRWAVKFYGWWLVVGLWEGDWGWGTFTQ